MKSLFGKLLGKRSLAGAFGAVAAGFGGAHSVEAAVIHRDVDIDVPLDSELGYAVDLGEDGVEELLIRYGGGSPGMKVDDFAAGAGVIADEYGVASLAVGTLIDSSDAFTQVPPESSVVLGLSHSNPRDFDHGPGYFGVEFELAGQTHYGYVGYDGSFPDAGHVFALGWNDAPGAGIRAGGVPEPSSLALLAAGAVGIGAYRRRRDA